MELPPQLPVSENDNNGLTRRRLAGAALAMGAGVLTACTSEKSPQPRPQPELADCHDSPVHIESAPLTPEGVDLSGQEWKMPGIEQGRGRLHIAPMPIKIMGKDGKDQSLLPLWPDRRFDADTLQVSGTFQLGSPKTQAAVLLAAELPTTYDDFQFPGKGTRVTVSDRVCTVESWDGKHKDPKMSSHKLSKKGLEKELEIVKKEGQLHVVIDGQIVEVITGYEEKQSWLGLEATNDDFTVSDLTVASPDKHAVVADMTSLQVQDCSSGLRNNTNSGCAIGAAMALTPLLENVQYAAIATGNFSSITTENSLKPQFVHPEKDVYAFEETERLVAFAERHGMQIHGHALLPNRSMPEWMRTLPTETAADKAYVKQVMVDHVTTIMKHFPTIQSFDIVNEALEDTGWRKDTVWHKAMGDEFINIAFAAAHKANPDAMLFINDYAMDKAGKYDENRFQLLLNKLQTIRKENPRALVGIGFEGHVYQTPRDCMSPDDLKRRMKDIMYSGMVTRVSEMDVTTHYNNSPDTTEQGLKLQAQQFGDIAKVCIESPACVSFTMWGIGGKYVSTAGVNNKGELTWGSNMPWDKNLEQRSDTYRALQAAIREPAHAL